MRIFITEKETDLEALASSLARTPRAAAATLARVKALNPHLTDAASIPKGGVLILPDGPDIKAGAGTVVGGVNLGEVAGKFAVGTRVQVSRAADRLDSLTADRTAVRDALKSAAAKRLVDSDPLLQQQLADADAQARADQKSATEARAGIAELTKAAQAEFVRLQKLFG
jgi:hypothetical protein